MLARSNGRIENYDNCRKPGLLCFLRQNPNLTLLGSYHKAELYHLKSDNPLQQTNSCKLNFLNAVRGDASLDISVGSSVN